MTDNVQREPLDINKLPYKYDPSHYHAVPTHDMHIIMCDLAIKLPTISYVAKGRAFINAVAFVDELDVFNDGEKVGKMWQSHEYIDGKHHTVYYIQSERIQNQRGSRNKKHSRIYKKALAIALDAFAPFENSKIASDIIENAKYRVTNMAQSAANQLQHAIRGNELALLEYIKEVADVAPTPVPPELLNAMNGWRDKLTNHQVAASVRNAMDACTGMFLKLAPSGVMTTVDLTATTTATRIATSYDLLPEYQEKFAILKIMEFSQPIAGVGVKVKDGDDIYFYMTAGAMQTTC